MGTRGGAVRPLDCGAVAHRNRCRVLYSSAMHRTGTIIISLARSHLPDCAQTSRTRGVFFVSGPQSPHPGAPWPPMTTDLDFHVFDTTLRDGAQREGVSYSVADKLAVARLLDEIGVGFIEGGWPGALPKDTEFFARARTELKLRHAQLVAFGATRKAGVRVEDDPQVRALLDAETPVVCLVAKSDVRHVREALRTTLEENLAMVADTVAFFVGHGRRVFLDCEHFFDGYAARPRLRRAGAARPRSPPAPRSASCATPTAACCRWASAGSSPTSAPASSGKLGIHCQDDTGCAVANSLAAVEAGVTHVQGTANGYGERAGNADTFALIGNLVTKMGLPVVPAECLPELQRVSHAIAELANIAPDDHQPFVGASAFAHKAGLHASAIKVSPELYNHLDPAVVGNDMRILVTEMAGRASIELKGRELGVDLAGPGRRDRPRGRPGEGARGRRLVLRGRRRLLRAAAARPAARRPGAAVRAGELQDLRRALGQRRRRQRGDGQGARRRRADHQHRRGQRPGQRAGQRAAPGAGQPATRSWPRSRWPTTRCASSAGRAARAPPPGCSSTPPTAWGSGPPSGVHDNIVEASWHALVDALTYAVLAAGADRG